DEERARAEEGRVTLIRELNHRVKNTLAIVQAIAWQSFTGERPAAESVKAFHARLLALAAAHDILTRQHWKSASLDSIVREVLAPHGNGAEAKFEAAGPDLELPPRQALAIAMAVHELATNAAKYGAFSMPKGRVRVAWTTGKAGEQRLDFRWQE